MLSGSGLADDTVVILLSDHGDMAGEHGQYGKKTARDASMRVPLLVRYPRRFAAGQTVSSLADVSVDTMPTLLELCGLTIPDAVQGTSYLSLLDGDAQPTRGEVYYEIIMQREGPESVPVPERGVRTRDWLYVRTGNAPTTLFDLRSDPLEMSNLVDDANHRDEAAELDRLLRDHMARTDDDWAIEAKFPPPNFMTHQEGAENARRLLERATVEP